MCWHLLRKKHCSLYLKLTSSSLTDHSGRKGHTLAEGSVNSWTLQAVSLPLFFLKSERMFWQRWQIVPVVAGSTRSWTFQHRSVWEMHSQLHGECQREKKPCCCKKAIVFEWEQVMTNFLTTDETETEISCWKQEHLEFFTWISYI